MRFSILQSGVVALICSFIAGCTSMPAAPLREVITFSYTPQKEAAPGSANVTFAVVGAQLVTQDQQVQAPGSLFQAPVPLFEDFANTMTKDFIEVLNARGFGVAGQFESYDEIIHPIKESSDLLLTAEVKFIEDMSEVLLGKSFSGWNLDTTYYTLQGSCTVKYEVTLLLSESLTNEPMWTKSITISPFTVQFDNLSPSYSRFDFVQFASLYGDRFAQYPVGVFIEKDNKFHADLGHALEQHYVEVLDKIFTYLDPREMAIVKKQAMELRKRKVY